MARPMKYASLTDGDGDGDGDGEDRDSDQQGDSR
jgi:hypothetical protein